MVLGATSKMQATVKWQLSTLSQDASNQQDVKPATGQSTPEFPMWQGLDNVLTTSGSFFPVHTYCGNHVPCITGRFPLILGDSDSLGEEEEGQGRKRKRKKKEE